MINLDQLLDVLLRDKRTEENFGIQGSAHTVGRLFEQWGLGKLTDAQLGQILNLDMTDSEMTTAKATIVSRDHAAALAIEGAFILAQEGIRATGINYNKAYLKSEIFGI